MHFDPVEYVVPDYIGPGCTLLAGRPKLGKSWLCLDFALAVASGGECLGTARCKRGDVLYLALEDNLRRLKGRILKVWGCSNDIPDNLDFATEWPRADEGGIEKIRKWIEAHPDGRLIIVDVLAMFRPLKGTRDQTNYDRDYLAIKGLQALASQYGIAIIVVHHTRKAGAEGDAFEKVSGTLALSGAADSTLILDRDGLGCTIYGRGRDIPEFDKAVHFDRISCRWTELGKTSDVRRSTERAKILGALKDAGEPMSTKDIATETGMKRASLDMLLSRMAKDGDVIKSGRGLYAHPDPLDQS